jgi:hypothetical protein
MAMIVLILQDAPDGVDVKLHHDPIVPPDQKDFTQAQSLGAIALNAIHNASIQEQQPEPRRIFLVDEDGLPN